MSWRAKRQNGTPTRVEESAECCAPRLLSHRSSSYHRQAWLLSQLCDAMVEWRLDHSCTVLDLSWWGASRWCIGQQKVVCCTTTALPLHYTHYTLHYTHYTAQLHLSTLPPTQRLTPSLLPPHPTTTYRLIIRCFSLRPHSCLHLSPLALVRHVSLLPGGRAASPVRQPVSRHTVPQRHSSVSSPFSLHVIYSSAV